MSTLRRRGMMTGKKGVLPKGYTKIDSVIFDSTTKKVTLDSQTLNKDLHVEFNIHKFDVTSWNVYRYIFKAEINLSEACQRLIRLYTSNRLLFCGTKGRDTYTSSNEIKTNTWYVADFTNTSIHIISDDGEYDKTYELGTPKYNTNVVSPTLGPLFGEIRDFEFGQNKYLSCIEDSTGLQGYYCNETKKFYPYQ